MKSSLLVMNENVPVLSYREMVFISLDLLPASNNVNNINVSSIFIRRIFDKKHQLAMLYKI